MIKKLTLLFFMLTFALLIQVKAQDKPSPEKQSAINELVALVSSENKAEELVKAMSAQMDAVREPTIAAILDEHDDLTAADKKAIREMLLSDRNDQSKRFTDKLMQKLDYNKTMSEVAAIVYDKYFTLAEVNDLITFYKTPTGQKSLKMMTPLITESMKLTQERLLPKLPTIIRELQEEDRKEIEQKINAKKPRPKRTDS